MQHGHLAGGVQLEDGSEVGRTPSYSSAVKIAFFVDEKTRFRICAVRSSRELMQQREFFRSVHLKYGPVSRITVEKKCCAVETACLIHGKFSLWIDSLGIGTKID